MLIIYHSRHTPYKLQTWGDPKTALSAIPHSLLMKQNFYSCQLDSFLDNFRKQYINPDIGDMVIFNGGRIWHKVADFDGDKNRITVGGFLAHSQDNQTVYCLI